MNMGVCWTDGQLQTSLNIMYHILVMCIPSADCRLCFWWTYSSVHAARHTVSWCKSLVLIKPC